MTGLIERLGLSTPIFQAPMAGVSTAQMAAAVSEAGGLGGIAVGGGDAETAARMIAATQALTGRPFNVNLFVHATPVADVVREAAWLEALAPTFAALGVVPPQTLKPPYASFNDDDEMLRVLIATAPAVVSFHFGLPTPERVVPLKATGAVLMASATSLAEAEQCRAAGMDVVIAQGIEAGGHRGMFDPAAPDETFGVDALTRQLVAALDMPVVAAGGLMDGADVRRVLDLGAEAAQLGTAFIGCAESAADAAYRTALAEAGETLMSEIISGRPARSLPTRFTALTATLDPLPRPDYPICYDAGKALAAAARAAGVDGYGAQWAGTGASRSRPMTAAKLMQALGRELDF